MNDESKWAEQTHQNLDVVQRLTKQEARQEVCLRWQDVVEKRIEEHDNILRKLESEISRAVGEIKSIKNALYFMALAIAANVPALQNLAAMLKGWLNL